jgi:hypothetical protein
MTGNTTNSNTPMASGVDFTAMKTDLAAIDSNLEQITSDLEGLSHLTSTVAASLDAYFPAPSPEVSVEVAVFHGIEKAMAFIENVVGGNSQEVKDFSLPWAEFVQTQTYLGLPLVDGGADYLDEMASFNSNVSRPFARMALSQVLALSGIFKKTFDLQKVLDCAPAVMALEDGFLTDTGREAIAPYLAKLQDMVAQIHAMQPLECTAVVLTLVRAASQSKQIQEMLAVYADILHSASQGKAELKPMVDAFLEYYGNLVSFATSNDMLASMYTPLLVCKACGVTDKY